MQQLDFWIKKRASQSPNKVALIQIETGEAWTYEQLMKHAYWWSEQFTKHHLQRGERVASLMENSIESFAVMFACRLNELIYVPLNTKLSKSELKVIVADCDPSFFVADDVHIECAKGLSLSAKAKELSKVLEESARNQVEVGKERAISEVLSESLNGLAEVSAESVSGQVEESAERGKNLDKVHANQIVACTEHAKEIGGVLSENVNELVEVRTERTKDDLAEVSTERVMALGEVNTKQTGAWTEREKGLAEVCTEQAKDLAEVSTERVMALGEVNTKQTGACTEREKSLAEVCTEQAKDLAEVSTERVMALGEVNIKQTDECTEQTKNLAGISVVAAKSEMVDKPADSSWADDPKLPWLIIYTGGTTGKPKGVVLSYEAVTSNAINTVISWGLTDADCTLNYMPLFHTGGINALALPILLVGGTVVIGQKFDPERAIRAIDEYKTTISLFVPTMYQLMTQTAYFEQSTFPTVKVFLSGGAPCPKPIYERFKARGLKFKEGYGLTEAGPNNFVIDANVAMTKKGAVGKSMLFNEVQVMNENGEPCSEGEVGELWLKGSHVFRYYWNNEQETNATFHNGWLKTGDLAKFDEDGDFYIVGRKKEMIITGGENVYPQEVEQCLITHPAVQEVTVIGVPDEKWGECVVAFIVLTDKDGAAAADFGALAVELKEHCKKRLANYKIPKHLNFVEELPKTVVGKIDKKQLQQVALSL